MKSEDISNTRELPDLKISRPAAAGRGELPELNLGKTVFSAKPATPAQTQDSKPQVHQAAAPARAKERTPQQTVTAPAATAQPTAKPPKPQESEPIRTGDAADDAYVIGRGFTIAEREESISLGSNRAAAQNRSQSADAHKANGQGTNKSRAKNGKNGKRGKKGGSGCLGAFVWIFVILLISVGLAAMAILSVSDLFGIGKSGVSEVNIEMGASTAEIADELEDAGAIRFSLLFRLYSKIKSTDGTYQYGLYAIQNEGGYDGIIEQLQSEGAKAQTTTVQIGEGWGVDKVAAALEEAGVCNASDFVSAIRNTEFKFDFIQDIPVEKIHYRLEGYLRPDTYDFYVVEDSQLGAEMAIRRMLEATSAYFTSTNLSKAEELGYSMHEVMTLASIIQLEAGGADYADMQKVAAVFYNRLEEGMNLGSSPTTAYPYGNGRYNTYEIIGLPPGPMCAFSKDALDAALNPTPDFDYLYFVTDANADFHFSSTLDEHNRTISSLQSAGNWLGDKQEDLENMFR